MFDRIKRGAARRGRAVAALIIVILASTAWSGPADFASANPAAQAPDEAALLDQFFTIDIQDIQATLTYNPSDPSFDGGCRVAFRMRPGQTRARFHFGPLVRGEVRNALFRIDGEEHLIPSISSPSILKLVRLPGKAQPALEIDRDLNEDADHVFELTYRVYLTDAYPRWSSNVNDIYGRGNEEVFPTVNSPRELARHRLTFRVSGSATYNFIGSGWVRTTGMPGDQEWILDTEREVASYTVMFAMLPAADSVLEERTIDGVPARIMAFSGGASIAQGFSQLESWLPQLREEYGPFPMPRGLSVFLTSSGGGMEYFGGTITSFAALRHEVHHMYFGCSTVAATYRDSWFDEAVTSWHQDRPNITPIADNYSSNMVNGRAPWTPGFDSRAYNEGAQVIEAMARRAGGRANFLLFLRDLHQRHSFEPFTTFEFVAHFREFSGSDMTNEFIRWMYMNEAPGWESAAESAAAAIAKEIDWTPPPAIQAKYMDGLSRIHGGGR